MYVQRLLTDSRYNTTTVCVRVRTRQPCEQENELISSGDDNGHLSAQELEFVETQTSFATFGM